MRKTQNGPHAYTRTHFHEYADILRLITQDMDIETALKARVACRSFHRDVKESGLEPLLPVETMQKLSHVKKFEHETMVLNPRLYTCDAMDQRMQHIANGWRTLIVDWIIQLNLHFKLPDSCLHTAVQIRDCYQGYIIPPNRETAYLLGIASFKIACESLTDLNNDYMPLLVAELGYSKKSLYYNHAKTNYTMSV